MTSISTTRLNVTEICWGFHCKSFHTKAQHLKIEGIICWTDFKEPLGRFEILGCINKIDLIWKPSSARPVKLWSEAGPEAWLEMLEMRIQYLYTSSPQQSRPFPMEQNNQKWFHLQELHSTIAFNMKDWKVDEVRLKLIWRWGKDKCVWVSVCPSIWKQRHCGWITWFTMINGLRHSQRHQRLTYIFCLEK